MVIELRAAGARALVLPEQGGRLHQLFVAIDGHLQPLLWGPDDPAQYAATPTDGGCFPMAPWPNRVAGGRFHWRGREVSLPVNLAPHAIHGRVLESAWDIVNATDTTCELMARLDDGWPWAGQVWQRLALTPSSLSLSLEVRAEEDPFPAGCGWHPWFRRDLGASANGRLGDVCLAVRASHRYVLTDGIPTGERRPCDDMGFLARGEALAQRRLDDCFSGLTAPVTIAWPRLELTMRIDCDQPHVTVFTPVDAFCIEPQTCVPDAFNLAARGMEGVGFAVARPGAPVRLTSTWHWTSTP